MATDTGRGSRQTGTREGSAAVFDVIVKRGVITKMRDGVGLVSDLYLPACSQSPAEDPSPCIIERTPYGRGSWHLAVMGRFYAARGYAVLVQDTRGRGDSEGEFPMVRHPWGEAHDGYDTVEWAGVQPWCNGRVGTRGMSFTGANQQALAILKPRHLVTQFIDDAGINYWRRTNRESGAQLLGLMLPRYFRLALGGKEAKADPAVRAQLRAADAEREEWLTRAPVKQGETPLRFTPSYEEVYFSIANRSDFDEFWKSPLSAFEEYIDDYPDIPVCFTTSWYGFHSWATFEKYRRLKGRLKSQIRVISGVWLHKTDLWGVSTRSGEVEFGPDATIPIEDIRLRWFDHHLKGLTTGLEDEPPIELFVMGGDDGSRTPDGFLVHGGRWRREAVWPPSRAVDTNFYLGECGSLSDASPSGEEAGDSFDFDPRDPCPTIGGDTCWTGRTGIAYGGPFDQRGRADLFFCRDIAPLSYRHDVLVFRTPPLKTPIEATGAPKVILWVATDAADTDFTAKLIDEYPPNEDFPDGMAMRLCDAIVRLRYRNGRKTAEPITPGAAYEIILELPPVSNLFAPGHAIRLDISSSNFPEYDVNPNTGDPAGHPARGVVARNTVFRDKTRPSCLILPIIAS